MQLYKPHTILGELRKIRLVGLARDFIRRVTMHHRIQGSRGLEEAIRETSGFLSSIGFEVKLFDIPSGRRGFMETPTSWDVYEGTLEVKVGEESITYDLSEHPTLVSAHSPPGEGCGEVVVCKDVSKCEGEVVLVEAPGYVAYRETSARLVILYDSKRYPEAVPYTGLFLEEGEVKDTSVVGIPYATALKTITRASRGDRVEACWSIKAGYSSRPQHGLIAYRGGDPGVLYMSHICHPKPSAHDNASGVASNILTAVLIEKAKLGFPHAHLFIPEYSGTIYADKNLPWIPIGVYNLDMVGSKQWVTNSTLNLVNPPLFIESMTAPYLYLATKLVLDEAASFGGFKLPASRYSISPYTSGSDHDVTLVWGLDSSMLNEWPSKYYHTDMDDVDSISPSRLVDTALISTIAGMLLSSRYRREEISSTYRDYLKSWYGVEALKQGIDVSPLGGIISSQRRLEYNPRITPISSRVFYRKMGLETYNKLRNIKGAHSYLSVYAPLARMLGIKDPIEVFQLENLLSWSAEEKEVVLKTWSMIEDDLLKTMGL